MAWRSGFNNYQRFATLAALKIALEDTGDVVLSAKPLATAAPKTPAKKINWLASACGRKPARGLSRRQSIGRGRVQAARLGGALAHLLRRVVPRAVCGFRPSRCDLRQNAVRPWGCQWPRGPEIQCSSSRPRIFTTARAKARRAARQRSAGVRLPRCVRARTSGLLRLTASVTFGPWPLMPLIGAFRAV